MVRQYIVVPTQQSVVWERDYSSVSYTMSYVPVGHGYNARTSVFQLIVDFIFKLTSAAIVTR